LAKRGRIIDAVARHAGDMPRSLQMLHDNVLVLGIYLGKTIRTRQQVNGLVAGHSARCLQIGHTPDDGQTNSLPDLKRHRKRVAGEHLYRNAEV